MTIASNKNTPRVAYTASANQLTFTIPFEFFAVTDIKVYNGTTLLLMMLMLMLLQNTVLQVQLQIVMSLMNLVLVAQ